MSQQGVQMLKSDPALAPYIEEYGPLEVEPAEDTFRRLIISLTRQQVSMDAAAAVQERLFDRFEITPEAMFAADEQELREVGLSKAKAEYVKHVANAYLEHGYDRAYFDGMDDEEVLAELTEIRGIGPWTGKMFLLLGLGRPDVFPVEDLGVRRGMEIVCGREMTRTEMRKRAKQWQPYRSYASLYLWRAYES